MSLLQRFTRLSFGALFTLLVVLSAGVLEAQVDDEQRLEELKSEREQIQLEAAAQALLIDVANANASEVAEALEDINALVDLQEARLADANQSVVSAERLVAAAEARQAEIAVEMDGLTAQVAELAIGAFVGDNDSANNDLSEFLTNEDPTEAARRQTLVEFQTGSLSDTIDRFAALSAEVESVKQDRRDAASAATRHRDEATQRAEQLADAQDAQLDLVLAAESRYEARLAEAQYIEELDAAKAAEIRQQEEAIAKRIREETARRAAAAARLNASRQPPPGADDMLNAEGFIVHKDVADNVGRMIRAALADGVSLDGYSYRSAQRTAELRVINGCPDVYNASPSSCRIPTARPGSSMHEQGKAIDFRSCWRGSECFTWLSNNASKYGYYNLPSESWHWSTNGR